MSVYQPGIPTGTVNLDVDYLNIQNNFQQLDTSFGVDHVPFSNQTAQNGYHTSIHFNPVSTTVTNPPNNQPPVTPATTPGFGQLFSAQINDGLNLDEALYFKSGGGRVTQLTRNIEPLISGTGYTSLPGGLIMQWGTTPVSGAGTVNVAFPIAFPTAVYNIQLTRTRISNSPGATYSYWISNNAGLSNSGFRIINNDGHSWGYYWMAIGR